MEKTYPLILVFYLDKELMRDTQIMVPFTEAVNEAIVKRNANAMAFFIPTNGEERIECINPVMVKEADMEHIGKMVEEIKTAFSIGDDTKADDITLKGGEPCKCGGDCKCND